MSRKHAVSSNSLPDLEIDLHPPWGLLVALAVWLLAVVISLWSVDGMRRLWAPLAAASLAPAVFAMSQVISGVAPTAVSRIVWSGDGAWRLRDGRGREWSATLASGSRRWGPLTLLVWQEGMRHWWAILTPATVGADQYRRLSVRLRLGQHA